MIKVCGVKCAYNRLKLEEAILDRNIMINFLEFLHTQFCAENFTFWLETQNYKFLFDEVEISQENEVIYEKYFRRHVLNIDDPVVVAELEERMKVIDRTTFMSVQNIIWSLLSLESFPKFRAEYGKSMASKMKNKAKKELMVKDEFTVQLYEKFLTLTNLAISEGIEFHPTTIPYDDYSEHIHQNLPDIEELWIDRDMSLAFREFLYLKASQENLSFYLAAVNYKYLIDDDKLFDEANEIYNYYINTETASLLINVDHLIKLKIEKNLESPDRAIYDRVIARVFKSLKNEWLPEFLVSETYQNCNNNQMEWVQTNPKEKTRTLRNYKKFVAYYKENKHQFDTSRKHSSTVLYST